MVQPLEPPNTAEISEMSDDIVRAFSTLYPRLALPLDVWDTLKEMISREIRGHFHPTDTFGADDLACDDIYIEEAKAAGLR